MRSQQRFQPRTPFHLPQPSQRQPLKFVFKELFRSDLGISERLSSKPIPHPTVQLPVPQETLTFAAKLLDQQFWCWGQDIVRPRTNALRDFGFVRHAPSRKRPREIGHYVLAQFTSPTINPVLNRKIGLWGSGLFYGESRHAAIYIRRYTFAPVAMELLCPIENIDGPDDFPHPHIVENLPNVLDLLENLCQWIAHYEDWVQTHVGVEHREYCLSKWKKRVSTASEIVPAWWQLASVFRDSSDKLADHRSHSDIAESRS